MATTAITVKPDHGQFQNVKGRKGRHALNLSLIIVWKLGSKGGGSQKLASCTRGRA